MLKIRFKSRDKVEKCKNLFHGFKKRVGKCFIIGIICVESGLKEGYNSKKRNRDRGNGYYFSLMFFIISIIIPLKDKSLIILFSTFLMAYTMVE